MSNYIYLFNSERGLFFSAELLARFPFPLFLSRHHLDISLREVSKKHHKDITVSILDLCYLSNISNIYSYFLFVSRVLVPRYSFCRHLV